MKPVRYWAFVLSANAAVVIAHVSDVNTASNVPRIVPNKFIMEVNESSHSLASVYSSMQGLHHIVTKEFTSKGLFTAALLTLNNSADANTIRKKPGVVSVLPVRQYTHPGPAISRILTSINDRAQLPPDTQSTHVMTGVDKLHAKGIIGTGIKIGIIDGAVDYKHPALGGGIGANYKFIGGYDFVGNAYDGSVESKPVPGNDPLDTCGAQSSGHGTHVAGIIGANPGNKFNISGVAYGASLSAYRVFGCNGSTSDDIVIEALLRSVHDGQDIITLSLGRPSGWSESASAVVASRIASSGIIVTISAGDDGPSGCWFTSAPGTAINAISVGSANSMAVPLQNATVHGVEHAPIPYFSVFPLPTNQTLPVYATSNDTTVTDDACDPLSASTPDLSSFIVVVRGGTCSVDQKIGNIAAKGGKFALIYNDVSGLISITVDNFTVSPIQDVNGAFLVEQFAAGVPISLSFPQVGGASLPDPTGGLVSPFSSYGPSYDFFFKPAVLAPGSNILSTLPIALGGYGILSGTSMSTAFVAGSSALLLATRGKTTGVANSARNLLESTAQKVPSDIRGAGPYQTLAQQGAGLINVFDAVSTTTILSPAELILNDTANFVGVQYFTVQNTGSEAETYTVNHVAAGTAQSVTAGSTFSVLGPVPLTGAAASVELSPSAFTLAPGENKTVMVTFIPPAALDPSTYPLYSGFIEVAGGSTGTVHASYIGLLGSLIDHQVIDDSTTYFGYQVPAIINPNTGAPQFTAINYTFVGNDYPSLLYRLNFGTPSLSIDLVKGTTTLNGRSLGQTIGNLNSFTYVPRNTEVNSEGTLFEALNLTAPTFGNGSIIENGSYRILMTALRVTANPDLEEDYEQWLSPLLGFNHA